MNIGSFLLGLVLAGLCGATSAQQAFLAHGIRGLVLGQSFEPAQKLAFALWPQVKLRCQRDPAFPGNVVTCEGLNASGRALGYAQLQAQLLKLTFKDDRLQLVALEFVELAEPAFDTLQAVFQELVPPQLRPLQASGAFGKRLGWFSQDGTQMLVLEYATKGPNEPGRPATMIAYSATDLYVSRR